MKHICIIVSLLVLAMNMAASPIFRFRHLDTSGGLPSNCVRDILQDATGYVWMATDGGLVRYDGRQMLVLSTSTYGGRLLADNFMSTLCEIGGELWVGTDNGVYTYSSTMQNLTPLPAIRDKHGKNTTLQGRICDINHDHEGNAWVSVEGQGIWRIDRDRKQAELYEMAEQARVVTQIYVDSKDNVWSLSNQGSGAVYRLNKATNRFETYRITLNGKDVEPAAIVMGEDDNHTLWLGSWNHGLLRLEPYGHEATVAVPLSTNAVEHIHSIMPYGNDALLVGSDNGLTHYDTHTGNTTLYRDDELNQQSLSNRFVYPIALDHEGGLWVGTFIGGVNYAQPPLKQFDGWRHSLYRPSLPGNIVARMCEDQQGQIWVATEDGGLACYSPATAQIRPVPLQGLGQRANLHALAMDGDVLWVGTYTQGIYTIDTRTGRQRHYTFVAGDTTSLDGSSSYSMLRDRQGRMWVTTMQGLNLYNRTTDSFRRIRTLGALSMCMTQDRAGRIWIATHGKGIYVYNPSTGQWLNHRHTAKEGSLPHDHVNSIYTDNQGTMWVGTENGLAHYDADTDTYSQPDITLPSTVVYAIAEEQGVMWITTAAGLVRYEPGHNLNVFTTRDGLLNNQFIANSILVASDGRIYLGSMDGLNAFHPHQIRPNEHKPRIVFASLDVDGQRIEAGMEGLEMGLDHIDRLTVGSHVSSFTVAFAALSFYDPLRCQYAFMLEGYDKQWHNVGSVNWATFNNLPAGDYRLLVKACNNDALWTDEPISLNIRVLPPWYLSWPMKVAYTLLAVGLIALGVMYLLRRNDMRHEEEIDRIRAGHDAEVYQAKIKFFTMIAHEIRTPVSLITGPLEKIMKQASQLPADVASDLGIIERNASRLLFLVNQLLDFKKVEDSAFTMHFAPCNVRQLLEGVATRFRPSVEQRGGRLDVVYPEADFVADVDAEALTKILSNLLNNARKFTRDSIRVSCHTSASTFSIAVADNGVGISSADQRRIFEPFYQAVAHEKDSSRGGTGLGLSLVQSLVSAHGGEVGVSSQPGQGATFTVTLPTHQQQVQQAEPAAEGVSDSNVTMQPQPAVQSLYDGVLTMLIVDDNEDMLQFVADNFRSQYNVLTATDGKQAWDIMMCQEVQMIVSDWMMPVMDGPQLCRAVRGDSRTSHIPFVMLTAKTDNGSRTEGMNCGADMYVDKPFSMSYLEACIRNLISMRRMLMQKYASSPSEPVATLAPTPLDNEFLTRLTEIIEQNLSSSDLSVDMLSEQMGISRSTLYSKIKTLTDVTPNELIQVTRLKAAARLLSEGRHRIAEVSYLVGFSSPSYFGKCFMKQFGMKPSEWVATQG